jgi:histone-lysine N-methyltransferase SETMAR
MTVGRTKDFVERPSKERYIGLNRKFLLFRRDNSFLKRLVTCDEKWIFYDDVIGKRQWCRPGEVPKPTPKKNLHSKKLMICV